MKMVCPHCGVNGSADDSLLDRSVKCPKCLGIFKVTSEIVAPIPVEELEMEQISDFPDTSASEALDEVDDTFDDIFASEVAVEEAPLSDDDAEIAALLNQDFQDEDNDDHSAVILNGDGDKAEELDQESAIISKFFNNEDEAAATADEDETLTIIENYSDDTDSSSMVDDTDADIALDDKEPNDTSDEQLIDEEEITIEIEEDEVDDHDQLIADDIESAEVVDEIDVVSENEVEELDIASEIEEEADEDEVEETDQALEDDEIALIDEEDEDISLVDDFEISEVEEEESSEPTVDVVDAEHESPEEDEEDAAVVQKCSACGEYVDPETKYEHEDNVYCATCVPAGALVEGEVEDADASTIAEMARQVAPAAGKFTIGTLIKDSWHYAKGAKGSIWVALIVMYLFLFGIAAAGVFLAPKLAEYNEKIRPEFVDIGSQIAAGFFSYIFTAGILLLAVRKVGHKPYSWKMVFSGFKKFGTLVLAIILQLLLLTIGFLFFILPGIYLGIGYILTYPLIMDKGMSPWQAMEASRIAIHNRWWTVFFSFIALSVLCLLSAIPVGIGLIWTVPMFFILVAVLYYHFFGADE